jgi:hypothetical protein
MKDKNPDIGTLAVANMQEFVDLAKVSMEAINCSNGSFKYVRYQKESKAVYCAMNNFMCSKAGQQYNGLLLCNALKKE